MPLYFELGDLSSSTANRQPMRPASLPCEIRRPAQGIVVISVVGVTMSAPITLLSSVRLSCGVGDDDSDVCRR